MAQRPHKISNERQVIQTDLAAKIPKKMASSVCQEYAADRRILLALEAGAANGLDDLSRDHFERSLEALATSTKVAIASDLDCYVDWCASTKNTAFPAEPETLARYIDARKAVHAKHGTIRRRIASISAGHRMLDLDPVAAKSERVRTALRALKQKKGSKQRQAFGLRLGADGEVIEGHRVTLTGLLAACDSTLTGLRDGALLSAGYDAGLRVSELTAMEVDDLELCADGTGRFLIKRSKTDQGGEGVKVWLSAETMRRISSWLEAAGIDSGVVFRRVHVTRRKARRRQAPETWNSIPGQTRRYQERLKGQNPEPALVKYTPGTEPLTRQGVNAIYRRIAETAWADGFIDVRKNDIVKFLQELSSHSLRVGLTQDLVAAGEEGVAIAKALRWKSTARVIHYSKELEPGSGAAQSFLKDRRK